MTVALDFEIDLNDSATIVWQKLPQPAQKVIIENSLNAILSGNRYPASADKLELVIDLVEAGADAKTISDVSQLDQSMVEDFMPPIK